MSAFSDFYQSKWTKLLAAGGLAFIGYAIYFDRKRRLDPLYKQKIRENRKAKTAAATASFNVDFPNPRDLQENEQFFFQQITLGEERMQSGDTDEGIFHFSNAVVSCKQPSELLTILQQTIPPDNFHMLIQAIPVAKQRQLASLSRLEPSTSPKVEEIEGSEEDGENSTERRNKIFIVDDELE